MIVAWISKTVSLELRKLLTYRSDFLIQFLLPVVGNMVIAYFLWSAIYLEAGETVIGGFTFGAMIFYYLWSGLVDRVVMGSNWKEGVSTEIYSGSLNRYLIYPVSFFFYKFSVALSSSVIGVIQMLLGFFVYIGIFGLPAGLNVSAGPVALAIVLSVVAAALYFLMLSCIELVAFWADNVWSLQVMLRFLVQIFGGALVPLSLYPDWAREILFWTPFPLLFSIPIRTAMGQAELYEIMAALGVGAVWAIAVAGIYAWVWKRGLTVYSGVGI